MRLLLTLISSLLMISASAQKATQLIEKGNQDYKKKQYVKADAAYKKALEKNSKSAVAQFNSGNANQRMKKFEDAAKSYEAAASSTKDPLVKAQAFYNQALAYINQKKLQEAIDAFKKSLRLNPNDKDARENLQKALKEKQQQQQQSSDQKDKKDKPTNKKNQQPKPSGLSKDEAEKMLNDLRKEEKNLQKQVQKKNQSGRQLKDW